jgi:hypothetical protein
MGIFELRQKWGVFRQKQIKFSIKWHIFLSKYS